MALNYSTVSQSVDEVRDIQNSPSVSMWTYLQQTGQENLLRTISIYGESGKTREQARILYMNAVALDVWMKMGKQPTVTGESHRPARSSVVVFGMPYSE